MKGPYSTTACSVLNIWKKGDIGLLLLSLLLIVGCQPDAAELSGRQILADEFREANEADTIEAMLALYALEGSSEQTVSLLKNALLYELGLPIRTIVFEPLSGAPSETIRYRFKGVDYGPTLEPKHRMRVVYDTEDGFESVFTIGQNAEGLWRIVSSRPIEDSSG
jgi:hypothetical protein